MQLEVMNLKNPHLCGVFFFICFSCTGGEGIFWIRNLDLATVGFFWGVCAFSLWCIMVYKCREGKYQGTINWCRGGKRISLHPSRVLRPHCDKRLTREKQTSLIMCISFNYKEETQENWGTPRNGSSHGFNYHPQLRKKMRRCGDRGGQAGLGRLPGKAQ